jgi:hypothetical protein
MRNVVVLLSLAAGGFAQNTGMTARQLYLQEDAPATSPGTKKQAKARPAPRPTPASAADPSPIPTPDSTVNPTPAPSPFVHAALHLGLRYNVLVVDRESKAAHEVDPDTNFRVGDCLAIRFTPNRGGYMFVFNEGSSGAWQPMLPSSLMPDESNLVAAGANTQVPKDYCFRIGDPPGTDKLVVVLTEKSEDMFRLNDAVRASSKGGRQGPPAPPSEPSHIGEVVLAMGGAPNDPREGDGLTSRDLSIEKVGQPVSSSEPPNSVYIATTGVAKSDRIVIEIKIRHE